MQSMYYIISIIWSSADIMSNLGSAGYSPTQPRIAYFLVRPYSSAMIT